ncbi:hypothetical protein F4604DRAFT_1709527 [Suillus subluteus]|nr:hypothetical protein F4604DRAFT_1709527 [Suillus subluteus]
MLVESLRFHPSPPLLITSRLNSTTMHYRMGSSSSSHSHKSWGSTSASPVPTPNTPNLHSVSLPIPIINAPHLHTVSLPHPNAHLHQPPVSHQHFPTAHSSMIVLHPLLSRAFVQLRPDCPPNRIWEFAVQPKVSRMTIIIAELPAWIIEVVNPHGITVNDVLLKIRETLNRGPSHAVNAAIDSFRARSRADQREHALGVKRLDFLGPKIFFAGLTRARDGSDSWNIHFSQNV